MKIQPTVLALSAILAGALILSLALPLQGQDSQPRQQQPPTKQLELSQDQLASFVSAVLEVQQIRSKWQPQIQAADSAEQAQKFQVQASAEMVKAVQDKGLTVETYRAIAMAAQDNPELASRITKLIEKQAR